MKTGICLAIFALIASVVFAGPCKGEKEAKEPMRPALLVIDIQNKYLPMMSEGDRDYAMQVINAAIWLFHENGFPVIRVYHTNPERGPKPGTEEFEFPSSVIGKPEDTKIVKDYPSAFKKTELHSLLREKGCNTLFMCGLSAVGCVLATYHSGMDLDYEVFMVKDGLLSHNATYTDFIEEICESVGFNTLRVILENVKH